METEGSTAAESTALTEGVENTEFNFKDHLPEDLRNHSSLHDIKDLGGLAKSYIHAQEMVGKSRLPMPQSDASSEEWDRFYTSLGRPLGDDTNGYGYKFDKVEIPEDLRKDENMEKFFRQKMHERGLTQKQAEGLYKDQIEYTKMLAEEQKKQIELRDKEWDQQSRQMFGLAHDEKVAAGVAIMKEFADKEVIDLVNETRIGNNPHFLKFMATLGEKFLEHNSAGSSNRSNAGAVLTPDQARSEISQLQSNPEFMKQYTNRGPGHDEAVKRMARLHEFAYPESQ